jgi:hypothetical protein
MTISTDARKLAESIQKEYNLTNYEALDIALKVEANELFRKANVISSDDSYPSALEKIAIELSDKL